MERSLRKGTTVLEIEYKLGFESINAILTSTQFVNNTLIVSTKLKPLDVYDADSIFNDTNSIINVTLSDNQIKTRLESFIKNFLMRNDYKINEIQLHILYGQKHVFNCNIEKSDSNKDKLVFKMKT